MSVLLRAHLALFMVNALYGVNHVVAKGVMPEYLKPNAFIFLRVAGAVALFWIVKLLFARERVERKDILSLALCALFGVAINQLFFFHGLSLTSAINSGIIMTVNPILVVILSFFILKEGFTFRRTTGILLGAGGAILLTLTAGTGKGDSLLGDMFIFINAGSYALYLVLVKPLMNKYSALTVSTWVFTFGLLFVCLFPPTLPELFSTDFAAMPAKVIGVIVFVIVGVTFLTYLLTVYGLKQVSPSVSSAYIYLQPVLVMVFAMLFAALHWTPDYTQAITWEKTGYMLLIFTGVYLTSSSSFLEKIKSLRKKKARP